MPFLINGKALKAIRLEKRLTQEQLADGSTVALATIKRIESSEGSRSSNQRTANKLAAGLGVRVDELTAEDFKIIRDIGGDIELHLSDDVTGEQFMRESMRIAKLIEVRRGLINKL